LGDRSCCERRAAAGMSGSPPVLVSIEAIIGAGKSTLLEELDARKDVVVVREPVDLWEQQRGQDTLLHRYYGDQKTNAFMFQTYAMMSHVEALRRALSLVTPQTRAIVMERSWLSARHCFVATLRESGHFDELEDSLHEDLFNWGLETWPRLDGIAFIDLPVDVAQGRVAKRGRTAESGIPSDYQGSLAAKHRQWLHGGGVEYPVLTLDGSGDKSDGATAAIAKQVMDFADRLHLARQAGQTVQRKLFGESAGAEKHGAETMTSIATPIGKHEAPSKRRRLQMAVPLVAVKA